MRLSRSFFNIYFVVIGSFILISWLMDEVWSSYVEQDIESYTGYKFMLVAIGDYLQKHPEKEWQTIIKNTSAKYNLPLALTPYSQSDLFLNNALNKALNDEGTFVSYQDDSVEIFHLLKETNSLISLGPAKMPTRPRLESKVRLVLLIALGGLILFLLWPISKDLDNLRLSANELGQGNFETKTPEAKSTMMRSLVKAFNMMSGRIKRLIEAQKELTNAVAHELRTPLARSKFALQMIEMTEDKTKSQKYHQQIANDVVELEALINEMLVYATFDSDKPKLNIKEVNLADIIQAHIKKQEHYHGEISFNNFIEDQLVRCDEHFIIRAFMNYLNNAQKYGKDFIEVTLKINNEQYQLSVADNGEGVSKELIPVLFDAFSRGDASRNKDTGGFGLGLAIVHRVMEWHQGRAWVDVSQHGGACFYLQWPIKIK